MIATPQHQLAGNGVHKNPIPCYGLWDQFFAAVLGCRVDRRHLDVAGKTQGRCFAVVIDLDRLEGGLALHRIGVIARSIRFVARQNLIDVSGLAFGRGRGLDLLPAELLVRGVFVLDQQERWIFCSPVRRHQSKLDLITALRTIRPLRDDLHISGRVHFLGLHKHQIAGGCDFPDGIADRRVNNGLVRRKLDLRRGAQRADNLDNLEGIVVDEPDTLVVAPLLGQFGCPHRQS